MKEKKIRFHPPERTHQEEQTSEVIKKLFPDIWEDASFLFFFFFQVTERDFFFCYNSDDAAEANHTTKVIVHTWVS